MRLALVAAVLSVSSAASAQPLEPRPRVASWFSAGAGVSTGASAMQEATTVGAQIVAPLGVGAGVFQVGVSTEFELLGGPEGLTEGHVAGGLATRSGPLALAVVAGPSVACVTLVEPVGNGTRAVARTRPGAYVGLHALLTPGRTVGVGAEVYGQVNAGLSTAGLRLFLAVGRLR